MASLTSLPLETITLIWSHLGYRDLVKSQSLNRFFNELVRNSQDLQYIIELGAAGYSPVNTTHSTLECLRRLEAQESFFENPSPLKQIKYTTFSDTDNHGNALRLHFTGFYDSLVVRILSNHAGEVVVHTCDFDVNPPMATHWPVPAAGIKLHSLRGYHRLSVDPRQDLMVLLSEDADADAPPPPLKVKLFSVRNGGSHPKAAMSTLSFPLAGCSLDLNSVAVAGPRLLLMGRLASQSTMCIFVADWEEGSVTQVLRCGTDNHPILTPVSLNHFVLAIHQADGWDHSGFIETYLIMSEKKDSRTEFAVHLLSRHEIPHHILYALNLLWNDSVSQNLNANPTSHIPYVPDPSRNILRLAIRKCPRSKPVNFFIPVSVFVDPRHETLRRHEVPSTVQYSWREWGPKHTASLLIPYRHLTLHPPAFMGTRLLTQSRTKKSLSCVKVAIKDFNQLSTRRRRAAHVHKALALHPEVETANEKTSSGPRRRKNNSSSRVIQGHQHILSEPFAKDIGVLVDDGSGTLVAAPSEMAFHEIGEWKCIDEQGLEAGLEFIVGIGRRWFWGAHVDNVRTVKAVSIFVRDE